MREDADDTSDGAGWNVAVSVEQANDLVRFEARECGHACHIDHSTRGKFPRTLASSKRTKRSRLWVLARRVMIAKRRLGLTRSNLQEVGTMDAGVGDRIVVESERAAQSGRAGVIEEVLADDPPRFRVRWDEGRTTIFAPSAGVARIERSKKPRVKA